MEKRPKIAIILSPTDRVVEILGWAALVMLWLVPLISYFKLPETVAVHFDSSGKVNGYGDKMSILILPALAVFIFSGLTALNKVPHLFNYPKSITASNAVVQYALATRMMRYLKLSLLTVFLVIEIVTCLAALGIIKEPGIGFLPVLIALIITPVVYFLIKVYKAK